MGVIWFCITIIVYAAVTGTGDYSAVHLVFGWRSMFALAGYLVMQIGLWKVRYIKL